MTISFTSRVENIGDRTFARLPAQASAELSSRGQVAVEATLNRQSFETVVEPDGRRGHWIALDAPGVGSLAEGARISVELKPRSDWPEPQLPDDFATALAAASDLDEVWSDITPMARWEWVRWINATRNSETRQRRVEVSLSKLRSGKRRPCCFDLSSCTDPEVSRGGKLPEG